MFNAQFNGSHVELLAATISFVATFSSVIVGEGFGVGKF